MDEEKTLVPKTVFEEDEMLRKFRRALRRSDQVALDDLIGAAKQHTAAMALEKYATRFEVLGRKKHGIWRCCWRSIRRW